MDKELKSIATNEEFRAFVKTFRPLHRCKSSSLELILESTRL